MVNGADIGTVKTDGTIPDSPRGDRLFIIQSKRKRGFYRALKAGKAWALYKQAMDRMMSQLERKMYQSCLNETGFMSLIRTVE